MAAKITAPSPALLTLANIRSAVDAADALLKLWCRDADKGERLPWPEIDETIDFGKIVCKWDCGETIFALSVKGPANHSWRTFNARTGVSASGDKSGNSLLDGVAVLRAMLKEKP